MSDLIEVAFFKSGFSPREFGRIKGDHHIFTREDIEEILNLQPKGSQAKPYQVRQVRQALVKYQLRGSDDAEV